jgi:tetratricopeptide (TPR) repeat protein
VDPQLELSEDVHERIKEYSATGDRLADERKFEEALAEYNRAWSLVPEPKNEWEAATWLLAASADANFNLGRYEKAKGSLQYAMTCPGGLGNPFLHLRLGQAQFELGDFDAAADELMRAYMGDGEEVFSEEDPKYLTFLGTRAKLDSAP